MRDADLTEGEVLRQQSVHSTDPKSASRIIQSIVIGLRDRQSSHVEMRGGNYDEIKLVKGLLRHSDVTMTVKLGLRAEKESYRLVLRQRQSLFDMLYPLLFVPGRSLWNPFVPEVVGQYDLTKPVILGILLNSLVGLSLVA